MPEPQSLADVIAQSRKRARAIDGADHDVKRVGISPRCATCGRRFRNDPTTPYVPIHTD